MQAIQGKAEPKDKAKEALKPAMRGDASLNEISGNVWRLHVKQDVTPQELDLHPAFFNALADEVREGDEILCLWYSGKHYARFLVVNVQNGAVASRLAYAVEGAPVMSAVGPKAFPAGYRIEKARPEDGGAGFIVVREKDGARIKNPGGVPWKNFQDAFEQFPRNAIFQNDQVARYVP